MYVRACIRCGTRDGRTLDRRYDVDMAVKTLPLDAVEMTMLKACCIANLKAEGYEVTTMKFLYVGMTPYW